MTILQGSHEPLGLAPGARLYLLRHGQTLWNSRGRLQGQKDSPLTWKGIDQARTCGGILARHLARPSGFTMVCSPLGRAWQTATIVAEAMGLEPDEIHREPRLMEARFGDWEGLTWDEIGARDPDERQRRLASRWTHRAPGGGESYRDVARRIADWMDGIEDNARLIVIGHGLAGRVLRGLYLGQPPEEIVELEEPQDAVFHLSGGEVSRLSA